MFLQATHASVTCACFVCTCISAFCFMSLCANPMINTLGLVIGERRGVVKEKRRGKYGGVKGYGCFSLGDRACCHGAGPPIGGSLVQSLNSADCFIIENFFLSSCLTIQPLLLHLSCSFFPLLCLSYTTFLFSLFHTHTQKRPVNYIRFLMCAEAAIQFFPSTIHSFRLVNV